MKIIFTRFSCISTLFLFSLSCDTNTEDSKRLNVFGNEESLVQSPVSFLVRITDGNGCWNTGVVLKSKKDDKALVWASTHRGSCTLPRDCSKLIVYSYRGLESCEMVKQEETQILFKINMKSDECSFTSSPGRIKPFGGLIYGSIMTQNEELRELRDATLEEKDSQILVVRKDKEGGPQTLLSYVGGVLGNPRLRQVFGVLVSSSKDKDSLILQPPLAGFSDWVQDPPQKETQLLSCNSPEEVVKPPVCKEYKTVQPTFLLKDGHFSAPLLQSQLIPPQKTLKGIGGSNMEGFIPVEYEGQLAWTFPSLLKGENCQDSTSKTSEGGSK